jgi:hypothetical protein
MLFIELVDYINTVITLQMASTLASAEENRANRVALGWAIGIQTV